MPRKRRNFPMLHLRQRPFPLRLLRLRLKLLLLRQPRLRLKPFLLRLLRLSRPRLLRQPRLSRPLQSRLNPFFSNLIPVRLSGLAGFFLSNSSPFRPQNAQKAERYH